MKLRFALEVAIIHAQSIIDQPDPLIALGGSLGSGGIQRSRETDAVSGLGVDNTTVDAVLVDNQVLAVGVDKETDQVRAHVVATEIGQSLAEVDLVKVNL